MCASPNKAPKANTIGASTNTIIRQVKISGAALRPRCAGMRFAKRVYSGQLATAVTHAARMACRKLCRTQVAKTTISRRVTEPGVSLKSGTQNARASVLGP